MALKEINIRNKKAGFEYHFLETFKAGMQLTGTEVKSLRAGKASISEAYCFFGNGELFIRGMNISEYAPGSYNNHLPNRERKLLLKKGELEKLGKKLKNKGLTIVPISVFVSDSNYFKIEIALAHGKKLYDKREDLKTKDAKMDMARKEM
jgi:SsrA-binding protein